MTKAISPIIFRNNLFLSSINKVHIKLNKSLTYLNYFKFFQLLLNAIYMYKKNLQKLHITDKFLYFTCNYTDFTNICLNVCFYDLFSSKKNLIKSYGLIHNFTAYLNYFISYNLYDHYKNLFIWVIVSYVKHKNTNKFYIMKNIKEYILKNSNYYSKIISFCSRLLITNLKKPVNLTGIKVKYSGCTQKGGNKKKIFTYIKGAVPVCSIDRNIDYISSALNTHKGTIGIKCWVVFE
uniref:Ribosomal protein S3 n=1 Tax=Babesia orientalis TaxID=273649 RepID=A0A0M4MPV2_9APIC|nr:ribosomal protein S3 [Babesia orientalis]ALE29375.1 ribosomal protein S3 [Babesia orientalis]